MKQNFGQNSRNSGQNSKNNGQNFRKFKKCCIFATYIRLNYQQLFIMRKITDFALSLSAISILACTSTLVVGCSTDENIDLGEIDTTIGVGSNDLTFPSNSTKRTGLGDLLELKENGVIDTLKRDSGGYHVGDYQFAKADTVKSATPKVKQFTFAQNSIDSQNIPFGITAEMYNDKVGGLNNSYSLPAEGPAEIASFNYSDATGNAQILSLTEADITGGMDLDIRLTDLQSQVSQISLDIYIPKYFIFDETGKTVDKTSNADYNIVKILNQPTSADYHLSLSLNKLEKFQSTIPSGVESYVVVNPTIVQMAGKLKVLMHFTTNDIVDGVLPGTGNIRVENVDLGKEFVITHAEGYFDPEININPTSTGLGDIPDFLGDDRVSIKLHNPTLKFEVKNNIDIEAFFNGHITAKYKDGTKKRLVIPNLTMDAAPNHSVVTTTIVLCRYEPAAAHKIAGAKYIPLNGADLPNAHDTIVVQDIAKILNTIPDSLKIELSAKANTTKQGKIDLYAPVYDAEGNEIAEYPKSNFGCGYEIKPQYNFTSPLELEAGSTIVYNDTINDLNKDLKDNDIEFYKDGFLMAMADVDNSSPLDLHIQNPKVVGVKDASGIAHPITTATAVITDENGNVQPNGLFIYKNGDPRNKKLCLKIAGSLSQVDGIMFEVVANVSQTTPETLNATKHYIQLKNMTLKLNGKISINLDSKN